MYRFGPFAADSMRGLLTCDGEPVPLTGKCFEVLVHLLKHRPAVVSKDDLMKAVWADTFVEESNLTQHVSMLRKALGESPQDRRYIVTVPGQGYRFVAEVEETEPELDTPMQSRVVELSPVHETEPLPVEVDTSTVVPPEPRRARWWVSAGVVVLVCVLISVLWLHREKKVHALGAKDSVLLADFDNGTGEPVFDGALWEGLAIELGQSPFLDLIDQDRVRETLGFMGRHPDEPVRGPLAREVCERVGAKALISGSIARLGSRYVIALQAEDCADGSVLEREQVDAKNREDVLPVLDTLGAHLRRRLGESLKSIQQFDAPMVEATTPSLEALRAYSLAVAKRMRGTEKEALPFLEHAIELDPKFAMAYAQLGTAYNNLGESERAASYIQTAYSLKDKLSEQEKLFISSRYHAQVTGDIGKATETYRIWTQLYPRSWTAFSGLASRYLVLGRYNDAKLAAEQALALQPYNYAPYAALAGAHLSLNEIDEAERVCQRANAMGRDGLYTHTILFEVAFLRHDEAAMEREVQWANASGNEDEMRATQASALMAVGKLGAARQLLEQSWAAARQTGHSDKVAYSMAKEALAEADMGNEAEARSRAEDALHVGGGIDAEMTAAEAFAVSGNEVRARALIRDLQQRFPEHAPLNKASLAASLAALELRHHRPAQALRWLEQAVPYDLSEFANLSPPYIRGQAYLQARSGKEAAAQFQTILDHSGIDTMSQRHSLAKLGLARAYLLMGDGCRSRKAYEEFFTLWSGADADIPELKKAREEYAGLPPRMGSVCQ